MLLRITDVQKCAQILCNQLEDFPKSGLTHRTSVDQETERDQQSNNPTRHLQNVGVFSISQGQLN